MYIELSVTFFLFLAAFGFALAGSAPTSMEYRETRREQRTRARAKATAAREARQALRRQTFGSHPILYGALAWATPVILLGLLALYGAP